MRRFDLSHLPARAYRRHAPRALAGLFLLCLLTAFLAACTMNAEEKTKTQQSVQTDNGATITYSTAAEDVLVRLFHGGGKVGKLEVTPDVSIYGDGTFITGPSLQLQKGSLSSEKLQQLL